MGVVETAKTFSARDVENLGYGGEGTGTDTSISFVATPFLPRRSVTEVACVGHAMESQANDNWLSDEETNRPKMKRKRGLEHAKQNEDPKVRLRVTQACDTCRRRKDRCDGVRPSCSRCLSCGRDCHYKQSNKKRGLRSGYVRTLEILLGIIFDTVEGSEDWITSILANKTKNFEFHLQLSPDILGNAADVSISRWRRSHVRAEVERLGSVINSGEDDDEFSERFNSQLCESLANAAARCRPDSLILDETPFLSLLPVPSIDTDHMDLKPPSSDAVQTIQQEDLILAKPDQNNEPYAFQSLDTSSGVQPQSVQSAAAFPCAWQQLDKYFHYTHCWLPLSEKHELLRIAYSLPSEEFPVNLDSNISCGEKAFLAAVFAYILSKEKRASKTASTATIDEELLRLLPLLEGMRNSARPVYDLGHVRALLLLTLIHIDDNEWKLAWLTVGRAIYIMVSLYNITGPANSTAVLDEGQRRTILACFALETLVATRIQRRTYLQCSDIQKVGMLSTDTLEEWEPWHEGVHASSDRALGQQQITLGHVPAFPTTLFMSWECSEIYSFTFTI